MNTWDKREVNNRIDKERKRGGGIHILKGAWESYEGGVTKKPYKMQITKLKTELYSLGAKIKEMKKKHNTHSERKHKKNIDKIVNNIWLS